MYDKTELLGVKGSWREVVDDCRATVGKESLGHEPSERFKRSILIAEHSPIRDIRVRWRWRNIPSWVATHWSRHKWECFISTQRSDRTGIPRGMLPQDAPVTFTGEANAQNLIDTWRKRLCYQAYPVLRGGIQSGAARDRARAERRTRAKLCIPRWLPGDVSLRILGAFLSG